MRRIERAKDGQPAERLDGGSVRGSLLRSHLDWAEAYGDPSDIDAVMRAVRRAGVTSDFARDAWLPFRALVAADSVIVQRFQSSGDEREVMEDIGRFTARSLFPAAFAEWSDDTRHRFFKDLATAERVLVDFALPEYRQSGTRRGDMIHTVATCFSRSYCLALVGFYEQCLRVRGAVRTIVSEETCQCLGWPMCKFMIAWR